MKFAIFFAATFLCFTSTVFAQTVQALPQSLQEYQSGVFAFPTADPGKTIRAPNDVQHVLSTLQQYSGIIKKAAKALNVPAIHIAAAIAAEHALNVNLKDTAQNNILANNLNSSKWQQKVKENWARLQSMIASDDKFAKCRAMSATYDYWYCVVQTWNKLPKYYGQNDSSNIGMEGDFLNEFLITFNMGFTYGYAQMNPLRLLTVNGLVPSSKRINTNSEDALISLNKLLVNPNDANFLNPDILYFVAAAIKSSINAYASIAHYDISNHPEITTTLYNIGHEKSNAYELWSANSSAFDARRVKYPKPNNMGFWVLQNQDAIAQAIQ